MSNTMEQIARIQQMEQQLDVASQAVAALSDALEQYASAQETIDMLDNYYRSDTWRQDYADDEAGRLPNTLKRGVLSEDGIWNLLTECRRLNLRLAEIAAEIDTPKA